MTNQEIITRLHLLADIAEKDLPFEVYNREKCCWEAPTQHPVYYADRNRSFPAVRVKAQQVLVPLSLEDVPIGSVFNVCADDEGWRVPVMFCKSGIMMLRDFNPRGPQLVATTWQELKDMGATIKRPGQDWNPCSKPA